MSGPTQGTNSIRRKVNQPQLGKEVKAFNHGLSGSNAVLKGLSYQGQGPDGRPDQLRTDVRTNSEIRTGRMSLPILDRCPDQFRTNVRINSERMSGSSIQEGRLDQFRVTSLRS